MNALGPSQKLLLVKMYNYERGDSDDLHLSDFNSQIMKSKNMQPLVEPSHTVNIGGILHKKECTFWKLTLRGVHEAGLLWAGTVNNSWYQSTHLKGMPPMVIRQDGPPRKKPGQIINFNHPLEPVSLLSLIHI